VEVGESIAVKTVRETPALGDTTSHFNALRRATTSTTLRALRLVAGIGESGTTLASVEYVDIARDFARRGLDLNDVLRAIRIGYAVLAAAILDAAAQLCPESESSSELRRISVLLFKLMDDFTGVAATAFMEEQTAWSESVSAARFDLVRKLVSGEPLDVTDAERVLGYPFGGQHLAILAWSEQTPSPTGHDLRSIVNPVLRLWGLPAHTLVVPVGSQTVWAWGAIAPDAQCGHHTALPEFGDTFVVVGQLHSGLDGFRRSHFEARAVERLVRMNANRGRTPSAYEDLDLEVLLLSDTDAAMQFVARHLGPLAADNARMADLRSTLRCYLEMDHSLSKVASSEHISRNTVTYRVRRALDLCGHPPGTSTTKLRAALLAFDWLGGAPDSR
jgi:DNA-binding PucR family transcriptional regulator